jgi:hypothetical protein
MKNLTGVGLFSGLFVWFAAVLISANGVACLDSGQCESSDFVMFAMISVGFVAPATIIACIMSYFPRNKRSPNA